MENGVANWTEHVKRVRNEYTKAGIPVTYSQALVLAKDSYKRGAPSSSHTSIPIRSTEDLPPKSAPRKPRAPKVKVDEQPKAKSSRSKTSKVKVEAEPKPRSRTKRVVVEEESDSDSDVQIVYKARPKPKETKVYKKEKVKAPRKKIVYVDAGSSDEYSE